MKSVPKEIRKRSRVLLISVVTTFLSIFPTFYVAWISGSVTLWADLLRCLGEFSAIFASWLVFKRISKPGADEFNFGFGKLEQFAGLGVGIAMLITFILTLGTGLYRLLDPVMVSDLGPGMVFSFLSVAGNAYIWITNEIANKNSPSPLASSQARLFKVKTLISAIVFKSLGLSYLLAGFEWSMYVDPIGSLTIALFVLRSALKVLSSSFNDLLDKSLDDVLQFGVLKALVAHESEYQGFAGMRSRRSGGQIYIELFLEFDPKWTVARVEDSIKKIRAELNHAIPGLDLTIALPTQD